MWAAEEAELGGQPVVVTEHTAQALAASDSASRHPDALIRFDQAVAQTLVVSLSVIMGGVLRNGLSE